MTSFLDQLRYFFWKDVKTGLSDPSVVNGLFVRGMTGLLMQRILWIGNPFFVHTLDQTGPEIVFAHNFQGLQLFTFDDLVRLANFVPDVVVVADKSLPPFVLGVEEFPCLTVFYAVDTHLQSWYPYYAQAFDLCLVSLKDHLPRFTGAVLPEERIVWFPPCAQDAFRPIMPLPETRWDCIFVGTVSADTPKRKIFLEALGRRLPELHVQRGNFVNLFPQAKVVLNYCEHGDLNFRVFEALGLGCALVTPRIANGQDELFTNEKDYLLFNPESIDDCLSAITRLLTDDGLRRTLAQHGLQTIDSAHRARHRAETLRKQLAMLWPNATAIIEKRREKAAFIRKEYLRLPYLLWAKEIETEAIRAKYLAYAGKKLPIQTEKAIR